MLQQIVSLVVGTLADLLGLAFLLRLWLQWTRAGMRHTVGGVAAAFTDWAVLPLRRLIPGYFGIDWAALLPAWALQFVHLALLALLMGASDALPGLALVALIETLRLGVWLLIGGLIVAAILSWLQPYSPWRSLLDVLTRPMLQPLRRFIPLIGGLDLTPLVAILLLQVVLIVLAGLTPAILPRPY